MKPDFRTYQTLEQTTHLRPSRYTYQFKLKRLWNKFGNLVIKLLEFNNDPVIREFSDRDGNKKWRVYDPITDKTVILASPEEVLIWLEGR